MLLGLHPTDLPGSILVSSSLNWMSLGVILNLLKRNHSSNGAMISILGLCLTCLVCDFLLFWSRSSASEEYDDEPEEGRDPPTPFAIAIFRFSLSIPHVRWIWWLGWWSKLYYGLYPLTCSSCPSCTSSSLLRCSGPPPHPQQPAAGSVSSTCSFDRIHTIGWWPHSPHRVPQKLNFPTHIRCCTVFRGIASTLTMYSFDVFSSLCLKSSELCILSTKEKQLQIISYISPLAIGIGWFSSKGSLSTRVWSLLYSRSNISSYFITSTIIDSQLRDPNWSVFQIWT